uniref:Uncharacterized protein n=1 Tax=Lepisosteus oculatus TaxID=7918 RepID=W5NNB4_LEPOC
SHNITKEETVALKHLKENKHIVIKPADKQYIAEAQRQLNNQEHYTTLEEPLYKQTALEIGQILQTLVELKHLTKKQAFYLRGEESPRPRIFYLLPKIHKAPETWPLPYEIPPGRPIVSDCNSESYRIAE